jgi:hypothetical protein
MAINYPTSLDNGTSLPYPSSTDTLSSPNLSGLADNLNDAIIALETKLGIADANSQTPIAGNLLASTATGESSWSVPYPASTIVGVSDTQTLTNKTIDFTNNTISNIAGANIASQSITATQIANATITATQIANGTIDYANLLPTIFSSQFGSGTNSGTAGGTYQYFNIGGMKFLIGVSAQQTFSPNAATIFSINYPFTFNVVPFGVASFRNFADTSDFSLQTINQTTTSFQLEIFNQTGSSAATGFTYIVIGQ